MDIRHMRLDEPAIGTFSEEREEYERDYARLIQSPAFRRLQGKSQVFGAGSGDYYRTRLTHSLEVSQIAREAARRLANHYPFIKKASIPASSSAPPSWNAPRWRMTWAILHSAIGAKRF